MDVDTAYAYDELIKQNERIIYLLEAISKSVYMMYVKY
jgi:hypothetical protein